MSTGSPRGLLDVRAFQVPDAVLDFTMHVLMEAGQQSHEAFVVWGGVLENGGQSLRFNVALKPVQRPMSTKHGALVTVGGDALFKVNKELYQRGATLAGQVHSHPGKAYHSDTDDHFPLVTLLGALSLVVPDFAKHGRHEMSEWAWYRLVGVGRWRPLGSGERIVIGG